MNLTAIVLVLLAQAAPEPSEAERTEAALKKMAERTYRILDQGKESGTATLKTHVEGEAGKRVVVMEDRFEIKPLPFELTEKAALDGLRLQASARITTSPEGKSTIEASVSNGDAYVSAGDRVVMIKTTQAAVGEHAVFRLVCLKEQKVGAAFKADVLAIRSERLDEERDFRCVAKESVEIDGEKRDAFKWEEKWAGKAAEDAKDPAPFVSNSYWVSPDGILLRFRSGPHELILATKK